MRDRIARDVRSGSLLDQGISNSASFADAHICMHRREINISTVLGGQPEEDGDWDVDVIDTWNMTVTPAKRVPAPVPVATRHGAITRGGRVDAAFGIELPGKPYLAVRVRPSGR